MKLFHIFAFLLITQFSCTHSIHQLHFGDVDIKHARKIKQGKKVAATSEQFVVMGFADNTKYVDNALNQLKAKCKNGSIQGITTEYSTSHGFFSWTNRIHLQGTCY